ncbi:MULTISPECIES: hypothetical protein [Pseudoalteromonas]|uniref:hypothetical protein n=1 Tax=Pseudoalteromonas TaxID=53246 RepID=UPI001583D8B0|nr:MULTISPECIES: hypothetical protein [Pseudoalteromonas]MDI4654570.1 hypothetical protein [Pseudoalteromonas shioyasakiensis]NUJ40161.1 hypothetical protein [Pseudoalteromonas sp. 0303]
MTTSNQAQQFLNSNPALLFSKTVLDDVDKYLELVETAVVHNHELSEGEVSIFSDGSCIVRIEESIKVLADFDTALDTVEWYADEYVIINADALVKDCGDIVFQDSYGNGVTLYNNESCATYSELAVKAGLDFSKYIGIYF